MTKKQQQPPRKKNGGGGNLSALSSKHHDDLCGITDPFCPHARGARVPDSGSGRTATEQIRFVQTMKGATDATSAAMAVCPKTNFPFLRDNTSADAWSSTFAANGNVTSLCNTSGREVRIVSAGVRIVSLLSATDSKGSLAIARTSVPQLVSTAVQTSPNYYTSYEIHPIGPSTEMHMIFHPTSNQSNDFNDLNDTGIQSSTDPYPPGWDTIVLRAEGVPKNVDIFRVEYVVNVEFTVKQGSAFQSITEPQPLYNPQMLVARNAVHNSVNHVMKGAADKAKSHLKQEAKKALTKHILPFLAKKGAALLA